MVSDMASIKGKKRTGEPEVLILVLMEYGLGLGFSLTKAPAAGVLILVLMEYGLGHSSQMKLSIKS